jgi:hypothetical protein
MNLCQQYGALATVSSVTPHCNMTSESTSVHVSSMVVYVQNGVADFLVLFMMKVVT